MHFWIIPGRETVAMDIGAVAALVGIRCHGGDGYLVCRNCWFEKIGDTIVQFDTMHAAGFRFLL